VEPRDCCFSAVLRSTRDAIQAGTIPKITPVTSGEGDREREDGAVEREMEVRRSADQDVLLKKPVEPQGHEQAKGASQEASTTHSES